MPTYVVTTTAERLTAGEKQAVADAITSAHNQVTGAQRFFAQVIFRQIEGTDIFIGGKLADAGQVFLHGHVRSRSPDLMQALINGLTDALHECLDCNRRHIWVYLSQLDPSMMVEFGKVLPQPGEEKRWLDDMPGNDRSYLEAVGA